MKWRNRKQSSNVDDRRNRSGGGVGLPSIGTILFVWPVIKSLFRSRLGIAILAVGAVAVWCKYSNEPYDIVIKQYYG
jgi:hypothetical protein